MARGVEENIRRRTHTCHTTLITQLDDILDNLRLKSRKRTKKHSFIVNAIGIATLLVVAILVLLYGRTELITVPTIQEIQDNDLNADNTELLNDEQRDALRQKYIAKMSIYENETKAQIENLNLASWSPESLNRLQTQEKEAIVAFGESRFAEALTHLDKLFADVSELQLLQQQNFDTALINAQQAFTERQIEQASRAIDDALRYLPDDQQALLLKRRIATMTTIDELVKAADIARIENNLADEINLLDKAIKLDPHYTDLIERHRLAIEKQRQQTLNRLLSQASQAIENKNIKEAQALLSQIKQIDAKHPSLSLLVGKAKQIQTELSYQTLVAKAETAAGNDDWQTAENYYRQALQIFPDNKEIEAQQRRASQINRYTQIIKQALAKPERLADDQISTAMKQLATDSAEVSEHSAQLQRFVAQLNDAIAEMSIPVAVTIYSDEQTYISVLGVGVIGKVSEYQLRAGLKPGRYLFKGERKGFKDKLVEVQIEPHQAAVVRVVCDETI